MIEISCWVLYCAWIGGLGLYCRSGNWKVGGGGGNGVYVMLVVIILLFFFLLFIYSR